MSVDPPAVAPDRSATLRRVKWGVIVGTALEWFDFYVYASMAAVVLGKVFFPGADGAAGTLAAFATFTVGFVVRPLGGVVLGYLADRIGRKTVLTLTFLLMGFSTALIGLIPSYAAIGLGAPVLLVLLRVLQGFGAGAEAVTATVVAYEHADDAHRGRQAAWSAFGSALGLLAASLTVSAITTLDKEALYTWGWRLPFLLSFLLIGVGFWVRRAMPETPEFERATPLPDGTDVARTLLGSNWRGFLAVLVFTVGYLGASYTFKTFSLAYLTQFLDVPAKVGTLGVAVASVVALVVIPLTGRLTDVVGYQRLMIAGAVGIAVLAFPFFALLDTRNTSLIWLALALGSGVLTPMLLATSSAFTAAQFPPQVRTTGACAAREIGAALSAGVAPLVALSLVSASPDHSTAGVSVMFVGAAALIVCGALLDQRVRAQQQTVSLARNSTPPPTMSGVG